MKYIRLLAAGLGVVLFASLILGSAFVEKCFLTDYYKNPHDEAGRINAYEMKSWPIYVNENELLLLIAFNIGIPVLGILMVCVSFIGTKK